MSQAEGRRDRMHDTRGKGWNGYLRFIYDSGPASPPPPPFFFLMASSRLPQKRRVMVDEL